MKEYSVREIGPDTAVLFEGYLRTYANHGYSVVSVIPKGGRWYWVVLERDAPSVEAEAEGG